MRDFLDDRPIKLRRERSNSPASGRPFLLALALCMLAGLLVIFDRQGTLTPVRHALQQAVAPVTGQLTALHDGASDLISAPRGDGALQARIDELERTNSQLSEELIRLKQAQAENIFLRQQLAIQGERPWRLLGAEVTVRSPDAGRRVILLARGTDDGLRPGMAVIGQMPGGPAALVGIIESAGPGSAEVLLITDIGSQVSGRIIHAGKAAVGLAQGQWQKGSRLRLDQIERAMPVAPGDPVVTAGLTAALGLPFDLAAVPADIPIGSVEQVGVTEQYQHADLRPFVDPDQVRYVWVILSQDA
ncbi:MAG: rod shape-determining protein MreC [Chloroflexales bacterium]|nr:rod shape-determining protein MreC [Chloroflexales bacterium]